MFVPQPSIFGVSGCDTVDRRKICAVTGHTCKSSLNSYSKVTSDKHKKLSVILDGSSEAKVVSVKPEPARPRPPKACKSHFVIVSSCPECVQNRCSGVCFQLHVSIHFFRIRTRSMQENRKTRRLMLKSTFVKKKKLFCQ